MDENINKNPGALLKGPQQKNASMPFFDKAYLLRVVRALTILVLGSFILFLIFVFVIDGDYWRVLGVLLIGSFSYFLKKNIVIAMLVASLIAIIFSVTGLIGFTG